MFSILLVDFNVIYLLTCLNNKSHDDSDKRLQK